MELALCMLTPSSRKYDDPYNKHIYRYQRKHQLWAQTKIFLLIFFSSFYFDSFFSAAAAAAAVAVATLADLTTRTLLFFSIFFHYELTLTAFKYFDKQTPRRLYLFQLKTRRRKKNPQKKEVVDFFLFPFRFSHLKENKTEKTKKCVNEVIKEIDLTKCAESQQNRKNDERENTFTRTVRLK